MPSPFFFGRHPDSTILGLLCDRLWIEYVRYCGHVNVMFKLESLAQFLGNYNSELRIQHDCTALYDDTEAAREAGRRRQQLQSGAYQLRWIASVSHIVQQVVYCRPPSGLA